MDLVEGLGDVSQALEFAVDDIGRMEIRNGRVRITLVAYQGDTPVATVSLVWSVEAYAAVQGKRERMSAAILARDPMAPCHAMSSAQRH